MHVKLMTVQVNGSTVTEIARRDEGNGKTILFLHGWLHSSLIWDRISPFLLRDYKLVLIDLPGFGVSRALEISQISIRTYGRILRGVVEQISINDELRGIVADSLSGVALTHACSESGGLSTTRLLMSGCPFDGLPTAMRLVPASLLLEPGLKVLKKLPAPFQNNLVRCLSNSTIHDLTAFGPEIVSGVTSADSMTASILFNELKVPVSSRLAEGLRAHRCTFLRGRYDHVASKATIEKWAGLVGAQYVELDGAGHTPMIEQPEPYAKTIRSMMA